MVDFGTDCDCCNLGVELLHGPVCLPRGYRPRWPFDKQAFRISALWEVVVAVEVEAVGEVKVLVLEAGIALQSC